MTKTRQSLFDDYLLKWVDSRNPKSKKHRLYHKNLYIFPSRVGLAFLLLTLIIWLLGTNYQNNLILALAYFQISLMVVTILNTYHNLSGLSIRYLGAEKNFVGDLVAFRLQFFTKNKHGAQHVSVGFKGGQSDVYEFDSAVAQNESIPLLAVRRGKLEPPRLLVESRFPMGLVRCWTWLHLDAETLVYPRPISCSMPENFGDEDDSTGATVVRSDSDDFNGFKTYQFGDAPSRVAWKHFARGRGLMSKQFSQSVSGSIILNWSAFYRGDIEQALSKMCYWALQYNAANRPFGLKLPMMDVSVGEGEAHLAKVLSALAEADMVVR